MRASFSVQASSADEDSNYWTKMMEVIRGEIQDYRSELDALTMKRTQMERKLKQVRVSLIREAHSVLGLFGRAGLTRQPSKGESGSIVKNVNLRFNRGRHR